MRLDRLKFSHAILVWMSCTGRALEARRVRDGTGWQIQLRRRWIEPEMAVEQENGSRYPSAMATSGRDASDSWKRARWSGPSGVRCNRT